MKCEVADEGKLHLLLKLHHKVRPKSLNTLKNDMTQNGGMCIIEGAERHGNQRTPSL